MKTKYKVGTILFAVLTALGLASSIFLLLQSFSGRLSDIIRLMNIIILLLIVFILLLGTKSRTEIC